MSLKMIITFTNQRSQVSGVETLGYRVEARNFDLVCNDFSKSCGYMQHLLGDGEYCISH